MCQDVLNLCYNAYKERQFLFFFKNNKEERALKSTEKRHFLECRVRSFSSTAMVLV